MRYLTVKEIRKRGCPDCADVTASKYIDYYVYFCKHKECPYRELDKYKSYTAFLKSQPKIVIKLVKPGRKKKK